MTKMDINTSDTVTGTCQTYYVETPNGPPYYGVSRREVRKLVRDVTSPLTRVEKPYHTKRLSAVFPTGTVYHRQTRGGTRYYKAVGDLVEGLALSYGPSFHMGQPYATKQYLPNGKDWKWNPDLLSQAETKCYLALRNKMSELDASAFLSFGTWYGERKETASLLRDAALATAGLVTAYKSLNARRLAESIRHFRVSARNGEIYYWAKQEIKALRRVIAPNKRRPRKKVVNRPIDLTKAVVARANAAVLTWNLGVSPLLNDLDRAYMATRQNVADVTALRITARGWIDRTENFSEVVNHTSMCATTNRYSNRVVYKCTLHCAPRDDTLAYLERLGLNQVQVVAELTTLSFLVNYFWGILDFLKASGTPAAFRFIDGSYSRKVSHLGFVEYRSSSANGTGLARGHWTHLEFQRKVYSTFPVVIPPLSLRDRTLYPREAVNTAALALKTVRKAVGW